MSNNDFDSYRSWEVTIAALAAFFCGIRYLNEKKMFPFTWL